MYVCFSLLGSRDFKRQAVNLLSRYLSGRWYYARCLSLVVTSNLHLNAVSNIDPTSPVMKIRKRELRWLRLFAQSLRSRSPVNSVWFSVSPFFSSCLITKDYNFRAIFQNFMYIYIVSHFKVQCYIR